jgi:toxin FitB
MYVLDTNVVSELRKARTGKADRRVVDWASSVRPASLFLSVVTLMELEQGTLSLERRDPRQGALIRRWLDTQVLPAFEGRVLPIDLPIALRCARLHVPDPRKERDALIAATALAHGMTVVTRDTADFAPTGVPLLDPWGAPG